MNTMTQPANDNGDINSPQTGKESTLRGDFVGQKQIVKERTLGKTYNSTPRKPMFGKKSSKFSRQSPHASGSKHASQTKNDHPSSRFVLSPIMFFFALCLWAAAGAGAFVYLQTPINPTLSIFSCVGVGWAALFLAYISKIQNRHFFKDLGLSSMLASVGGVVFIVSNSFNMPISMITLCGSASVLTILLAGFLKERYFLTVSVMAATSWTLLSLNQTQISSFYWVFPLIWAVQMALSISFKAKLPLAMATLSGLIWLGGHTLLLIITLKISILMAISAIFVIGMAYLYVGRLLQEKRSISSVFQANLGWTIAAICALVLQDYWLMDTLHAPWSNMSTLTFNTYPLSTQWIGFVLLCTCGVAICAATIKSGYKHTFLSKTAFVSFTLLLPISIAFHTQILAAVEAYTNLPKSSVGILIGAAISLLALNKLLHGLRTKHTSETLLALGVLCLEAILLIDNLYTHPENAMVFASAVLIMAITIGVLQQHKTTQKFKQVQNHA
ncbi:MAG: hypothetical protein COA43_15430 [Robiginitomaculum sp.]|nr:MAG: hypothetical protein COA43_15430 [Robiginitomaculum sp.]